MSRAKWRSPRGRIRRVALAVLALATVSACAGYRSVTPDGIAAPSDVRIQFAPARDLWVLNSGQDSLQVTDVVEVYGRVTDKDESTVTLDVSSARVLSALDGRPTRMRFGSGTVARVPMENVQERYAQGGRTLFLVLGLVVVAAIVISAATAPDPEPTPPKEPKTTTA